VIVQDVDSYCFGVIDVTGREIVPCIYEHLFKSDDDSLFFFVYDGDTDEEYEFHNFDSYIEYGSGKCGVVNDKGQQIITAGNTYLKLYSNFILEGKGGVYKTYPSDTIYNLYSKQGDFIIGGFKEFHYDEIHKLFFFFFGGEFECGGDHYYDYDEGRDYYKYYEEFNYGDNLWLILNNDLKTVRRNENGEQIQFKKGFIGRVEIKRNGKKKNFEYNFPLEFMTKMTSDNIQEFLYKCKKHNDGSEKTILINDGKQVLDITSGIISDKD
jgi:hypothetical protein